MSDKVKVVLIGESTVGKSALFQRLVSNTPPRGNAATMGIAFEKITVPHPVTGKDQLVQIWDTAGQEKIQSVTTHHYRGTDGVLVVFDVGNPASLSAVPNSGDPELGVDAVLLHTVLNAIASGPRIKTRLTRMAGASLDLEDRDQEIPTSSWGCAC